MNKSLIKLITFVLIVAGIIYLYFVPFTKYQITSQIDTYFDYIQETKTESLTTITTKAQSDRDKGLINDIALKHSGQFEFTNRSMRIIENTQSEALVQVSVVIKANVGGDIVTEPQNYVVFLQKALNPQGKKTWIITERAFP